MNRSRVKLLMVSRAPVGTLVLCAGMCAPALASAPPTVVPTAPAPAPMRAVTGSTGGVILVPGTGSALGSGAGAGVRISLSAGGDVRIRRPGGDHVGMAPSAGEGQSSGVPAAGALGEQATVERPRLRSNEAVLPDGRVVRLSGARSAPQGDGGLPPERPAAPAQTVQRPDRRARAEADTKDRAPSNQPEKPALAPAQVAPAADVATHDANKGKVVAGNDAPAKSGGKEVKPAAGKEGAQAGKTKPAAPAKPAQAAGGVGTVRRDAPKPAGPTVKEAPPAPASALK